MWLYQILDILGTLLETIGVHVSVKAYCPNRKRKLVWLLPPAVFFVTVYFWTWFMEDVTFKMITVLVLTFGAYKVVTREASIHIIAGLMTQQVYVIAANALAETISSRIFSEMTVLVGGRQFLKPQVYVLYFVFQIVFMLFFHSFMKKFAGGIDRQSLIAISISFFIIELPANTLTIAFHSGQTEWFNVYAELVMIAVAVLFVVLLVYIKNYLFLREQEQRDKMRIAKLEQQFAYYQDKQKDEERIRAIYHDMKNHLLLLEESQGTDETRRMARELRAQIADYENYIHTGNAFLDIIIKDKAEKAREKKIDFSAAIDFEGVDFIEPLDLSTLFGNGIDNAIEASEKLPQEARVIVVKAGKVRNFVSILMENNCLEESPLAGRRAKAEDSAGSTAGHAAGAGRRTTKPDRLLHGFGISNMQRTAEKYGGTCTTRQAAGKFTLKILLPVP